MSELLQGAIQGTLGLYDTKSFFKEVNKRVKSVPPNEYCMVAIDIEHFRLYNKIYGRESGDHLLAYIVECIQKIMEHDLGCAGYLGGDNFAIFMPHQKELIERLNRNISSGVRKISDTVGFLPAMGVCVIEDTTLSAMNLHDRAAIALSNVIGNYTQRICYYDDSMTDTVEEEIKLLSEIQEAIRNQEFTFFAQPQCDISTGKIVGAESLVRWYHHSKGLISPAVFIPVLEKNGFIADLDRYVWDKVCAWIRSWLDRGYRPVPISVNASRIDILSMDVPAYFRYLIKKYDLQADMIKVEITESAYAENDGVIKKTVKELRESGFRVMMDDFGSGYSSLNMLKNVAVDVLKIDMRFLQIGEDEVEKGIGILESVVNMSRQMGVPIIVEGVETKQQEDYLIGMGCRYTQGFFYYKPLPIAEFEKVLSDEKKLDFEGLWSKQVEAIHVREFLDSNIFTDTMLNNLLGATVFYDIYENTVEITRVNEQFYQLAAISTDAALSYCRRFWERISKENQEYILSLFEKAYANQMNGSQGYIYFRRADGKILWVYIRLFFLREREGHKLFYGSLTDVTFLKEEKNRESLTGQKVKQLTERQKRHLEEYYGDMPCAYGVAKIILDEDGRPCDYEMVYVNHEMECTAGSIQRLRYLAPKLFGDSAELMLEKAYQAAYLDEKVDYSAYSMASNRYLQFILYQFEYGYVSCILNDITHIRIHENALQCVMDSYQEIYFIQLQDNSYRMVYPDKAHLLERGNYEKAVNRWFETGKLSDYDIANVKKFFSLEELRKVLKDKDTVEYKHRMRISEESEGWYLTSFCVSEREKGVPKSAVMMIRRIDELFKEEELQHRRNMAEFLAHSTDGFFVYRAEADEKVLFANQRVLSIYGCESIWEFRELVNNSFKGMVHPDDFARVDREIEEQLRSSEQKEDYVEYRIIRKDGEIRWVAECAHLDMSEEGNHLFYVFITDVTDKMRK